MPTRPRIDIAGYYHIILAYLNGYSQIEIANYLELSKSLISKVIKSGDSTAGV